MRSVPQATTKRLSLYLRVLADLQAAGVKTVSSQEIADRCRLKAPQVRKDLSRFGGFGVRGVGYDVTVLRREVAAILGLDRDSRVVIVGAGNLGNALGDYPGFDGSGFRIVALFDVQHDKIGGSTRRGRPIRHLDALEEVVAAHGVEVGIVAVPAEHAQSVVDRLVAAGVHAILNFAPIRPTATGDVLVRNVDLKVELESLSFFLAGR